MSRASFQLSTKTLSRKMNMMKLTTTNSTMRKTTFFLPHPRRAGRQRDKGTQGNKEKGKKGQRDKETKGQRNKGTKGKRGKGTKEQRDERIKGKGTKGQRNKRTKGQND